MYRFLSRAFVAGAAAGLTATGALSGVPGAGATSTSWVQFHQGYAHTGWNSTESILNPGNVSRLHVVASSTTGGLAGTSVGSPIIVDSRVFVLGGNWQQPTLVATDRSGRLLWSTTLGADAQPSELASGGGLVVVGIGPTLRAYSQSSGARVWSAPIGGQYDSTRGPTVAGSQVFAASGTSVYALSLSTGARQWVRQLNESVSSFVAYAQGRVFVATYEGATTAYSLRALSSSTGATLWRVTGVGGVYGGGPAVKDGVVYLAGNRSGSDGGGVSLTALRASDGTKLWSRLAGDDVHSIAAVDASRAYVGTIDGSVHAFNKSTGALVWATPATGEEIWSSISSANGVLYLTRDSGAVQALNAATGALLWSSAVTTDSAQMSSVAVADGRIYVGGTTGVTVFGL